LMIARCGVTENSMLTAGLSSPAAPNLASIIKGVSHECTLLLVHLCNTLPARLC
jgi:hypothetical protein